MTGIETVDNDEELWRLNVEIQDLYSSLYRIDYKDKPVYFDKVEEKFNKDKMLDLIKKLIIRLEQINDGSFVIDDRETERIRNL